MSEQTVVQLTLACGDYDINSALVEGEVQVAGARTVALTMPSPERHWRLMRHQEFNVCELSMASYLALRGRGDEDYIAVPVFPHRRFRHSYIFVNSAANIREAKDLAGRSIGLRTWQTTAGLWTRGILEEHYGVPIQSVDWVTQDEEDIPIDPGAAGGFRLRRVTPGDDVDTMLVEGRLDALIYPELPPSFRNGDPRIVRLFPNAQAEEARYFQQTGIFPIMHTVVIRRDLLEQYPWLAMNVVQAFRRSKDLAFKRMEDPRRVSLAWFREALEEQRRIMGPDPWAYDLPRNQAALDAICRYAVQQGLTSRLLGPDDLFAPASLDEPPKYVGS